MLNFRKLKQDFSPAILKDGKTMYEKKAIVSAKIIKMSAKSVRLSCRVSGNFENAYQCEIEIERRESMVIDSDCDCPYKYDCQHLSACLFYLEEHFEEIVVAYSKEADLDRVKDVQEKAILRQTFKEAENKEVVRRGKKQEKELLQEYVGAAQALGQSPFFLPEEVLTPDKAELALVFNHEQLRLKEFSWAEIQIALRLPYRSKPLIIPNIKEFFDSFRYGEALYIGGKRYFFNHESFDPFSLDIFKMIMDFARHPEPREERNLRTIYLELEAFGSILAYVYALTINHPPARGAKEDQDAELIALPCFYCGSLEEPLCLSKTPALLRFALQYLEAPSPKILLQPDILLDGVSVSPEEACFFECAQPGMIHRNTYFRFHSNLRRKHLRNIGIIRDMTIPEPLFGTFVENSLQELMRFAEVPNRELIESFVTLPYVGQLEGECDIHYLDGELEAGLNFVYEKIKVPALHRQDRTGPYSAICNQTGSAGTKPD